MNLDLSWRRQMIDDLHLLHELNKFGYKEVDFLPLLLS